MYINWDRFMESESDLSFFWLPREPLQQTLGRVNSEKISVCCLAADTCSPGHVLKCNNGLHGVHWLTFICFWTLFFCCCLPVCVLVTHSCSSLSCPSSSSSSSSFILVPPHSASLTFSPSSPLPLHVRHFWPMAVVAGDAEARPPA